MTRSWRPDNWSHIVNNACGSKPSVIVMSSCFSGQFVPALAGDNRMVITAARPDRTSFGCGERIITPSSMTASCSACRSPAIFRDLARQDRAMRGASGNRQMEVDDPSEPHDRDVGKQCARLP